MLAINAQTFSVTFMLDLVLRGWETHFDHKLHDSKDEICRVCLKPVGAAAARHYVRF